MSIERDSVVSREQERYVLVRENNSHVSYEYFYNIVAVDEVKKRLTIEVCDAFMEVEDDSYKSVLAFLKKPDKEKVYKYCNQTFDIAIGEGLISFTNTNLVKLFEDVKQKTSKYGGDEEIIPSTSRIYTHPNMTIEGSRKRFKEILPLLGDVFNSTLYLALFPPLIKKMSAQAFKVYSFYVTELQNEYKRLLEFCFDVDFYADDLKGLSASTRFILYREVYFYNDEGHLLQRFYNTFDGETEYIEMPEGKTASPFEKTCDLPAGTLDLVREKPVVAELKYACQSLEQMFMLEFYKMLELDIKIKKCRNCGNYFILKGNYKTEYCTNIPDGETQCCQNIAAKRKYQQKFDDSDALKVYNKYYKRYLARVKVNQIKLDVFKKWKFAAITKRNECLDSEDEKVAIEIFTDWLENSFPNRKKK